MTFIVALCAKDGVAMAADGLSHRAIEPPEGGTFWLPHAVPKVVLVAPGILCAFAGDIPVVQPALASVDRLSDAERSIMRIAEIIASAAQVAQREAEGRYVRLHGHEVGRQVAPRAHFLIGGLDRNEAPKLLLVDSSGQVSNRTKDRFAVAGTPGPYADFAATMVHRYFPASADRAAAEAFAFSLLDSITKQGFFRIFPPVRVWSTGRDAPAAEVTGRLTDRPPALGRALSDAMRRLAETAPSSRPAPKRPRALLKVKTR